MLRRQVARSDALTSGRAGRLATSTSTVIRRRLMRALLVIAGPSAALA